MKHKTAANYSAKEISLANGDDLVISMDDYVRLREIVGDHDLADELDRAIVVPSDRIPRDVVTMNSRLIYADESAGTRREVELVFPNEADPLKGRVSVLAPVGCALLGLRVGQSIDWNLPNGHVHRLRVERVLCQPNLIKSGPAISRALS
jgi:regulator of nucleoside diphosphate kinase